MKRKLKAKAKKQLFNQYDQPFPPVQTTELNAEPAIKR